jgi:hypothetical protein
MRRGNNFFYTYGLRGVSTLLREFLVVSFGVAKLVVGVQSDR